MSKFDGLKQISVESNVRESGVPGRKRERSMAKRANPDYQQISAYVRRDLYEDVRRDLIGKNLTFSDLLEQWIVQWSKARSVHSSAASE